MRLALFLLSCVCGAQTAVRPDQIINWQQVAPLVGQASGTQIPRQQLGIPPDLLDSWMVMAKKPGPLCFEVAVPAFQPTPVLISECYGDHSFWFATDWDTYLSVPIPEPEVRSLAPAGATRLSFPKRALNQLRRMWF